MAMETRKTAAALLCSALVRLMSPALCLAATDVLPLAEGWRFIKADDPKYACDANCSN